MPLAELEIGYNVPHGTESENAQQTDGFTRTFANPRFVAMSTIPTEP